MAEEIIGIFATRAERYPEPDDSDKIESAARTALSLIPGLDGALSLILPPAIQRRREGWLKELADELERLESEFQGFKAAQLVQNEVFVSATLQASRIAVSTHQPEKRAMLRNALANIAVGRAPDEDLLQLYLNAIDAFSPSHVKVLRALHDATQELIQKHGRNPNALGNIGTYGNVIRILIPELTSHDGLVECIITDLRSRNFSILGGRDATFPSGAVVTSVGIGFLQFVLEPPAHS